MELKHRGKILEAAIKTSGLTAESVATAIGKTRRMLYNYYDKDDLSLDILLKVGNFIKHDFSKDFPEVLASSSSIREPAQHYGKRNNEEFPDKIEEDWKRKYFDLLEQHNRTLRELNRYMRSNKKK